MSEPRDAMSEHVEPYTFEGIPMDDRDVLIAREGFKNGAHFMMCRAGLRSPDLYRDAVERAESAYPMPARNGSPDDTELDGTDGAHPAWWRGCDHGVEQTCRILGAILDGDTGPHHFGSAKLTELAQRVTRLRAPAQLGSALVEALRGTNPLHIMADGRVWKGSASQITTDATRALASLLAAFPQEGATDA